MARFLPVGTLVACGEDPLQYTVELFDRKIFADVTVGASAESRVHVLFIVTHPGENNDGHGGVYFANESGEGNAIHPGHFEIDDDDFAIVVGEPGGSFEPVGNALGGVAHLLEIGDEETGDTRIIVDNQELTGGALREVHCGVL